MQRFSSPAMALFLGSIMESRRMVIVVSRYTSFSVIIDHPFIGFLQDFAAAEKPDRFCFTKEAQ